MFLLAGSECEIVDFKTGWHRDAELNPDQRSATKLTLSYIHGEADVPVPAPDE